MPGEPGRAAPAEGMTPGAGKIRLVLDYVPCDACLEEPAATWEEQELYCSVCRRLDRTVGYKATVRRFVNVPSPDVPEEVTVEPGPLPAAAPVAGSPLAVEFVLQEASEDGKPPLPPPEADVQVVLEPLLVEPRVPEPEHDVPVADEDEEDEWVMEDPFGFTPVETSRPEERAAAAAVEAKSGGAEASYTLDPWEDEDEGDVVAEPEADEDVPWPEHDVEDETSPEPEAWPDQEEETPQKEPEVEEYPWPDDEQEEESWEEPEAEAPPEPEPRPAGADEDAWPEEAEDVDDVEEIDIEDVEEVEEVDVEDVDEDTGEERR